MQDPAALRNTEGVNMVGNALPFAGQPSLFDGAKTESEPSDGEPQKCTILGVGFLRFFTPLFCEFMPLSPVPATVYYFQHFFSKT